MKEKFLLFLIFFLAAALRIFLIFRDSVPFAYDMGRDLLWTKDIAFYHIPTLIGPAASIWGVYFGPFWFYFLSLPLVLGRGHPLSAVYATSIVILLTGFFAYFLFKNYLSKLYVFVLAVIILFSGTRINISTFAFHANLLPLLTIVTIYFYFLAILRNSLYFALSLFMVSIMFHADPAPAVVFTIISILLFFIFKLYNSKNLLKMIVLQLVAYLIPFVPQILFEFRNNFVETKALVSYFMGGNPSLSGQLPFFDRIANRVVIFFDYFKTSFAGNNVIFALTFLIFILIGLYRFKKSNKSVNLNILFKINLLCLLLAFIIFTFLITVEIKTWYINGLTVIFAFLITFAVYSFRKFKLAILLLIIIYFFANISPFFDSKKVNLSKRDPASLTNQLRAMDIIYLESLKTSYSIYVFTPSIYDYNWQYLLWWKGVKLKKGLPLEFAYLPNKPDYVRNKQVYASTTSTADTIYLIIENAKENEFYTKENWLNNFDGFEIVWQKDINSAITVQKRAK